MLAIFDNLCLKQIKLLKKCNERGLQGSFQGLLSVCPSLSQSFTHSVKGVTVFFVAKTFVLLFGKSFTNAVITNLCWVILQTFFFTYFRLSVCLLLIYLSVCLSRAFLPIQRGSYGQFVLVYAIKETVCSVFSEIH